MVVGAFPVAKLGALLLKQISKPIANALKEQAKNHPVFKRYVCLPPAQLYNWCEEKAKMWVLNLGKPVSVPVYNEKMAVELGANLLGEGIIFVIAAGILISEYNRSSRKEAAKEEAKRQEMEEMKMSLRELFIQTEEQGTYIRELRRKVGELDTKLGLHSKPPKKVDSTSSSPPPPQQKEQVVPELFEENDLNIPLTISIRKQEYEPAEKPNVNVTMLLQVVSDIENEFWKYTPSERRVGIVNRSLNYLYGSVYGIEKNSFL